MSEDRKVVTVYKDLLGEGFHVALRKASGHEAAHRAWLAIRDLPAKEWEAIIAFVIDGAEVPK